MRRCNLSCGYCNEYDKQSPPVPPAVLNERIDKLHALGTLALTVTGGEPLLHPGVFDVVQYARRLFVRRAIITNAYLLTEGVVDKLNESGLTDMQISVDGVMPNDLTVKTLKPLREKLAMVAKRSRFRVNLNSVIGAAPPQEVLEVLEFAKSHGFKSTVQVLHDGNGQINLSDEEREVYEGAKAIVDPPFWNVGKKYTDELIARGRAPFKCRAGCRYLYIDEFGNVSWCSQTRRIFQKPLLEYSFSDLQEQFYKEKGCEDKCTVGCVRSASALDSWRAYGSSG